MIQTELFADDYEPKQAQRKKKNSFDDYDAFVDKFKTKLTTDDCYTPPDVYNVIYNYVAKNYDLTGKTVLRPFKPNGDYLAEHYDENTIVIDNPPFSIITQICRYYIKHNIKFFLFAPYLTLFVGNLDCSYIVCAATIEYENGAKIATSFITNIFAENYIIADADLYNELEAINEAKKVNLLKYTYPDNVLSATMLGAIVNKGVSIKIPKKQTHFIKTLQSQKALRKAIFGGGFLLSDAAAAEKAAAEKAAAEKVNRIIWEISDEEQRIIETLNRLS